MRRLATLCLLACSFAAPALAATRAKVSDKASYPADIAAAKKDSASLFNHPDAFIQTSDVGGHIATLVEAVQTVNDGATYGVKQTVRVEITDPFHYYAQAGKADPKAILGNAAYKAKIGPSAEYMVGFNSGANFNLARTNSGKAGATYRGEVTLSNTGDKYAVMQGEQPETLGIGSIRVSVAGQKGWNSREGQNYEAQK